MKFSASLSRVTFNYARLQRAEDRTARRGLFKGAAFVRTVARRSIRRRKRPSTPGNPPATQSGRLRKGVLFHVEPAKRYAIVGPSAEFVGRSAAAHEFGGTYKKDRYPRRPFMGPALDQSQDQLARFYAGEFK